MYYVPQLNTNDCGVACVKMLLATLNKDRNYLFMPYEEKENNYSFFELIELAKQYDCFLEGYFIEFKKDFFKEQEFPLIAIISLLEGAKHAVLVLRCSFGEVEYIDPKAGKVTMRKDKFLEIFEGHYLKATSFDKNRCPYFFEDGVKKSDYWFLFIMQIIAGVSLIMGVYFLNDSTRLYIPIIFFFVFLVSEVIFRFSLSKNMKKMDAYFLDLLPEDKKKYQRYYVAYANYKKSIMTNRLRFAIDLLILGFLVVTVLLNGLHHIFLAIVPVILAIISTQWMELLMKRKQIEIASEEEAMFIAKNSVEFKDIANAINSKSYKLSYKVLIEKVVMIIFFVLCALLSLYLEKTYTITLAVFYICLQLAIYETTANIIRYPNKQEEKLKAMATIGLTRKRD
mgnify:CR=1 FL=1